MGKKERALKRRKAQKEKVHRIQIRDGCRLTRTTPNGKESFCVLCDVTNHVGGHIGMMFWKGKPLSYVLCPRHPLSPAIGLAVEAEVEKISPWPEYPKIP